MASGTGVAGVGGTHFVGSSSCCVCLAYDGTGGAGLGGAPRGAQ